MIPYIRSLSELMAITESRYCEKYLRNRNEHNRSKGEIGIRKGYIRSKGKDEVNLPNLPKEIRRKWMRNKVHISRFIDELDYNNQIQSSYDLTLLEGQNNLNQRDVA